MAKLFYLSTFGEYRWRLCMKQVGAQIKPYKNYLHIARESARNQIPVLQWRAATEEEIKHLEQNRNDGTKKKFNKHDHHKQENGNWIILEPLSSRPEESENTFEAFLHAEEVYDDEKCFRESSIKVMDYDKEGLALYLYRLPKPIPDPEEEEILYPLIWLGVNTYTLDCQRRALEHLDNEPSPRLGPLIRLLTTDNEWPEVKPRDIYSIDWEFLKPKDNGPLVDGTQEQRKFVSIALDTPDFAILEGPPGSGKTTGICELIVQSVKEGKRIMLVASTHVAVDNVLERILEWQENDTDYSKYVFPVRIGKDKDITSEIVKPWSYKKLEATWREKISSFLDKPGNGNPFGERARNTFRKSLKNSQFDNNKKSFIENLILESSNLVCGTTIGILQHPAIKNSQWSEESFEPFDIMILDEASKTTFSEFLVPAVHAKKWVVVGDIHQLSPYVEDINLADNIRELIPPENAAATAHSFLASLKGRRKKCSLLVVDNESREIVRQEAEARDVNYLDLDEIDEKNINKPILEFLYADLIFGSRKTIIKFKDRIPADLLYSNEGLPEMPGFDYSKRAYLSWKKKQKQYIEDEPVQWANEISWRLIRSYELRQNDQERSKYQNEIKGLIPISNHNSLEDKLNDIRRVAMPSILELLQTGFERLDGWDDAVPINEGLPEEVLKQRFISLKYQFRMHPEISVFSRKHFYTNNLSEETSAFIQMYGPEYEHDEDFKIDPRLLDKIEDARKRYNNSALLLDATGIKEKRSWTYERYKHRSMWIDVIHGRNQKNENPQEVDAVIKELEKFVKWAEKNPKYDAKEQPIPWEVAILTFYRGQETLFKENLRQLTGQKVNSRNFRLPKGQENAVKITLCTVDRFQGHEADMVFLSFVKTSSVGFLNSPNRLNVGITRGRYQLVIFGKHQFFENCRSDLLKDLAVFHSDKKDIFYGRRKK